VKNIITIKCALRCFELASGLNVNFRKSKIAGICVHNIDNQIYFKILNCNIMEVPFIYLGVPLGDMQFLRLGVSFHFGKENIYPSLVVVKISSY